MISLTIVLLMATNPPLDQFESNPYCLFSHFACVPSANQKAKTIDKFVTILRAASDDNAWRQLMQGLNAKSRKSGSELPPPPTRASKKSQDLSKRGSIAMQKKTQGPGRRVMVGL